MFTPSRTAMLLLTGAVAVSMLAPSLANAKPASLKQCQDVGDAFDPERSCAEGDRHRYQPPTYPPPRQQKNWRNLVMDNITGSGGDGGGGGGSR